MVPCRAVPTSSSSARSCGAEVSPYITECPYCGTRLRKRAPKLEQGRHAEGAALGAAASARTLPAALRPGEIPGIRADRRPCVDDPAGRRRPSCCRPSSGAARATSARPTSRSISADRRRLVAARHHAVRLRLPPATRSSRSARSSCSAGCSSAATAAWAPLLVFLVGGAAGSALVRRARPTCRSRSAATAPRWACSAAWTMRDLLGRRRGREDDADLLGVLAIALVLVLLPLAIERGELARRAWPAARRPGPRPRPRARCRER